jgi:hypothetical protein
VTTLSILALALTARMLLRGLTRPSLLALAVICVLGVGTKATFVLTLAMAATGVVVAALLHRDGSRRRALLRGVAWATALAVPPVLAWGWFYQRNYRLSGSWYVSTPKETPLGGRPYRSTLDNLTSLDFYLIIPHGLVGRATDTFVSFARGASTVVFAVACALTLLVLVARLLRRRLPRLAVVLVLGLLVAHLAGSYVLQLSHATGYGAYNWRYFLPSTPTIAMILAVGLVGLGRWSAVALPAFVAALFGLNAVSFMQYGVHLDKLGADPWDVWGTARVLAAGNGWPEALPGVCLVVAALAVLGLGVLIARHRAHFAARA